MKPCKRVHLQDLESGDTLEIRPNHTTNFGWVIQARNNELYYVNDGWDIRVP